MLRTVGLTSLVPMSLGLGLALAACTSSSNNNNNGGPDGGTSSSSSSSGGTATSTRFFMPTGAEVDNTSAPTVEIDKEGGIHSLYPAYAGGDAYYAYCPANCSSDKDVKVVKLETDGTVGNAMLALDASGKPQLLLSTYLRVYYASCEGDCTTASSWTTTAIIEHNAEKDVTGEAFALDPQGHPRFVMHTYRAFLGIGQKEPRQAEWVTCDSNCNSPGSWKASVFQTDLYHHASLRFDSAGKAHMAAVAELKDENGTDHTVGVYQYCAADCDKPESWSGPVIGEAFEKPTEAVAIQPQISLALTKAGQPRVLFLGKNEAGGRQMLYFECNENCTTADTWSAISLDEHEQLSSGFDLALDQNDHPRVAFALDFNIGVLHCDQASCTTEGSKWDLSVVEKSADIPADAIFLYTNCNVGAWFLHNPSIALNASGQPRIGYQARDISGGTKPGCTAGTDMTWARMAVLSSL